jgi:hypothetical protein
MGVATSRQAGAGNKTVVIPHLSRRETYVLFTIPWTRRRHVSGATKP